MLKKQYVKTRNSCKVTFELPKEEIPEGISADNVCLLGDFNEWDAEMTPMKRIKKTGAYKATVELEPNQEYQFRYLIDGEHWCNDSTANRYVPNGHGSENGVVVTQ